MGDASSPPRVSMPGMAVPGPSVPPELEGTLAAAGGETASQHLNENIRPGQLAGQLAGRTSSTGKFLSSVFTFCPPLLSPPFLLLRPDASRYL